MKKEVNKALEFIYQGTEVHFLVNPDDKNVMINATEMAKAFGKRTKDYLANQSTKDLISELERTLKSVRSKEKVVDKRGHVGIYFNEILALDFAAWLDIKFKIWIYTTIRDLLTKETKIVKTAVNDLTEKEIALNKILSTIQQSDNEDAKQLLIAISELEEAKKNKTKAVTLFSKQMSINF